MLFSGVWSENAALFERFMKIHSNPLIIHTILWHVMGMQMKCNIAQILIPCIYKASRSIQYLSKLLMQTFKMN